MLSTLRSLAKTPEYKFVFITVSSSVIVGLLYLRHLNFTWMDWTGFEGETLWSVLELLIIPVTIAGVAAYLERLERKADRDNIKDNQREAALQNYFDSMMVLILDKGLEDIPPKPNTINIAQVKTFSTLERLNGVRKGKLVKFLYNAHLIKKKLPENEILDMKGADLTDAYLVEADLKDTYLEGADLKRARLIFAHLENAHLKNANLVIADLAGADLTLACLEKADLRGADLMSANLKGVRLEGAKLNGAKMPDGKKYDPAIHTIDYLTNECGRKDEDDKTPYNLD